MHESRDIISKYLTGVLDPGREVARIEIKGNKQRKKGGKTQNKIKI